MVFCDRPDCEIRLTMVDVAPMARPDAWIVDMRHYTDERTGDLPDEMPEPALNLALFFGAIVAWVTDHLPAGDEHTNVPCRRRPGRRRCRGDILARLDAGTQIVWECPLCGDRGWIHGWEDTPWNRYAGPPSEHSDDGTMPGQ